MSVVGIDTRPMSVCRVCGKNAGVRMISPFGTFNLCGDHAQALLIELNDGSRTFEQRPTLKALRDSEGPAKDPPLFVDVE